MAEVDSSIAVIFSVADLSGDEGIRLCLKRWLAKKVDLSGNFRSWIAVFAFFLAINTTIVLMDFIILHFTNVIILFGESWHTDIQCGLDEPTMTNIYLWFKI